MSATWTSGLPEFEQRLARAQAAGLVAAAAVLQNTVKRSLRGGFTSGKFVTGRLVNSVTRSEPTKEGGEWTIRVGTNVMYALYFELGHVNLFMRRYVRVEKWRPAMLACEAEMREAYTRVVQRVLDAGPRGAA